MKKKSLEILHRYRSHMLERDQVTLQDKIAEENQQKARLLQLQARVKQTHEAKLKSRSVEELCDLDESAAWLHGRVTLARRALQLSTQAREDALRRVIQTKQSRDQVEHLIDNAKHAHRVEQDYVERQRIDEMVTARYAANPISTL